MDNIPTSQGAVSDIKRRIKERQELERKTRLMTIGIIIVSVALLTCLMMFMM
jgi:flagellar biosynthesis/type III secretory pathway M-ring protein FliF/YscJ